MKKYMAKAFRDNYDTNVLRAFRNFYPNFEYEHRFLKLPLYPKIVLYSNVASVDRFLEQIFPSFKIINPKPSNESDDIITKQIATEIVYPKDESAEAAYSGVIVKGFPFNINQALLLDRYLRGVNLALHVKGGQQSEDFGSLLKYYSDRGTLVEVDHKDNLSFEELENTHTKITMSMKRSE